MAKPKESAEKLAESRRVAQSPPQPETGDGENDKDQQGNVMDSDDQKTSPEELKKGRKRSADGSSPQKPVKYRKKVHGPFQPKNALMQLNELKPGLSYVVESQEGPPHNPVFVVSVECNGERYIGKGHSKQLAKHSAAQAALASFVQFRNMPEALQVIRRRGNVPASDFTSDSVESDTSIISLFDCPRKNANGTSLEDPAERKSFRTITESDKKNPVMLLNELQPGLGYSLMQENGSVPSQRFTMSVRIGDDTFEGSGPNKRMAKAAAARMALSKLYNISYHIYPSPQMISSLGGLDLPRLPHMVADKIARAINEHFSHIMTDNAEYAKWKVLAGIALTTDPEMEDVKVITLATGTKCIGGEHISMNGAALNDCHAEVIARRCLKDYLYSQLELHAKKQEQNSILCEMEDGGYCLKQDVKFHLFISTSPCGDARIFSPREEAIVGEPVDRHPNRKARGLVRTKIESGEGTIPVKSGESVQTWDGIIQGSQRLLTMSCSDKIARWNVLGLQGSLLSHFIEPIYLESVILGSLFHPSHMYRATCGRIESALGQVPSPFRLSKPKLCSVSSPETRHLNKSPNFSVNWTVGKAQPEIINATTGKTEGGELSRISKRMLFTRFNQLFGRISSLTNQKVVSQPRLYSEAKASVMDYQMAKEKAIKAFEQAGLGTWVKKPVEQDEFEVNF